MPADPSARRSIRRAAFAVALAIVVVVGLCVLALTFLDWERQTNWSPPPGLVAVRAATIEAVGGPGNATIAPTQVFRIPSECVVLDHADRQFVWSIVGPDGRLTVRAMAVTIVAHDGRHVLVSGALEPGDRIVVDKATQLVDRQSVRIIAPSS